MSSSFAEDFLDEFFFIIGDELAEEVDKGGLLVAHEDGECGFNIAKMPIYCPWFSLLYIFMIYAMVCSCNIWYGKALLFCCRSSGW